MVNGKFYLDILRQMRENTQRKRQWHNNSWTLHHDNDPASTNTTAIPHPPYSPDLAPCDFILFPKMKLKIKGRCFKSTEEI
jgi:hypothetical protein